MKTFTLWIKKEDYVVIKKNVPKTNPSNFLSKILNSIPDGPPYFS